MKLFRSIDYFSQLRALIGFKAACTFTLAHIKNKIYPPREGKLAYIPVGRYVFYFPSLDYFVGLFTEIFFRETYFLQYTNQPIRVIDCGANIGMSLIYIKIRAPHAQVLCFEPNPAARAVLEKNIEANGWRKEVRVLPYALGKEKGTANFFVENKVATSSGGRIDPSLKDVDRDTDSYTVDVDTLSQYIDSNIDLLKMDIEGGEFDVLEELVARHALERVAAVQLEYHYMPGSFTRPLSDVLVLFESSGFRTFVQPTARPHQIIGHNTAHAYMVFAWR